MSLLPAMPSGFKNGHALDANLVQRVFHGIQFRNLNNRFDLRHCRPFRCPLKDTIVRPGCSLR
jgi:hypothetical protein